MTFNAHLENLVQKHIKLESEIQSAYNKFLPDSVVQELKKRKLAVKQEIEFLKTHPEMLIKKAA